MTSLAEQLRLDLTEALRARDEVRVSTLRLTLTSIQVEQVSGAQARTLSEDEVRRVLTRERKRRVEAAEAFEAAGRLESAARERAEAEVLSGYLPQPLSPQEIEALVDSVVTDLGASGPRETGRVIKEVLARSEGRADGSVVAPAVKARLSA